ncbi:hypothetical protein L596_004809 [Steinernema carpocapsae]|uniref:Saposin B-type domain-containing protein n=1 Tax=Steinernema carpocapsae TaxID=34508 RepID=A0A4U8UX11_STECR|nr:hypothetical protein L596_004809 [Steinernema carpocapsae]
MCFVGTYLFFAVVCFLDLPFSRASDDFDYGADNDWLDDNSDETIQQPMLTLSCTLCEQFFSTTLRMRNSPTKKQVEEALRHYCAQIGVFKTICNQSVDVHLDIVYDETLRNDDATARSVRSCSRQKCQKLQLCPGKHLSAFCRHYYDDGAPLFVSEYFRSEL